MTDSDSGAGFSTDSARFASIETYGVRRRVKVIGVLESELDTLSALNAQAAVWLSVCTALASLAAGIWITAAFTDKPTPEGNVLAKTGAPIVLLLSVVFGGMSALAWWKRRSTRNRTLSESLPTPNPPSGVHVS